MTCHISPADRALLEDDIERTIRNLLVAVDEAGLGYVIARNVHYIPSILVDRGDLDVLVSGHARETTLARICAPFGLVQLVHHPIVTHAYFQLRSDFFLHIDFIHGATTWLGAKFLPDEQLFAASSSNAGFRVASDASQAILMWFQSLLWGGFFKDRYKQHLLRAADTNPVQIRHALRHALGYRMGDQFWAWLVSGTPENSAGAIQSCRRTIWWRAFRRNPWLTCHGFATHFAQELALRLRLRPGGLLLLLIGPDGSGKSTICQSLIGAPATSLPFGARHHIHFIRPILPDPGELRRGHLRPSKNPGSIVTDPHGKSPHPTPVAIARMGYFLFSAWISDLFWARHQIAKNALIVQDRHLIELSVDPARYRFRGPGWIARLIGRLAPKPDLTILLDAPVNVLQARKQEVSRDETARQRLAYRELVQRLPNGHIVDASRSIEEVTESVNQIILDHLANRLRRRFKLEPSQ